MGLHRVLTFVALLACLATPALAGGQEEQFVRQLAQKAERAAREGVGQGEVRAIYGLLQDSVAVDSITARAFGGHWADMNLLQRKRAIDIMGKWSARVFAQALTGRESLEVTGSSEDGDYSRVQSMLSISGTGVADPLPVEWLIGRHLGRFVVEDIIVAGRSSAEAQGSLIDQLFGISPDVDGVLQGLQSVGLQ